MTTAAPGNGDVIAGRYVLQDPIGSGRFAVVHRARDRETDELVALKLLRAERARDRRAVARFELEQAVLEAIPHRTTVRLLAAGYHSLVDGGPPVPYMVQELVRGMPLVDLLDRRGALPLAEAGPIVAQVLDGLHEAHLAGVLHRDLKPHNLLVVAPPDRWSAPRRGPRLADRVGIPDLDDPVWTPLGPQPVKLLDFGLAKRFTAQPPWRLLPVRGQATGAICYMAPEQARCDVTLDQRADVYGAAMLLFRLLAGRPAFLAATRDEIAQLHVTAPPPPLPAPWDEHAIGALFRRGAAKARDERFATAAEMAWRLREVLAERPWDGDAPPFVAPPPAGTPAGVGALWSLHRKKRR